MKKQIEADSRIKKKIMGWKEFTTTYVVMLFLVGMQTGIYVFPPFSNLHPYLKVVVIMGYWAIIALIFALITNWQIKHKYDNPMRKLSSAAKQVAEGDFSVYVEPNHTADEYDYIDVMFTDFNVMVQELGSIETLKNDFVANVSHEIKTPLAIIKNYTTMLKKDGLSPELRGEYIDTIGKATDNLSSLVTNILRLNKLENQEIELPTEQYDLCAQLSECILGFESLLDEKQIEISAEIEDCAMITADRNMLEIVWNNLISNALKFTTQGGKVSFVQTSDADTITVSITDTGCGISDEAMRHIFDKFFQAEASHSGEGNGLGLALAHRVIEKLGGTLSVQSELGIGSTFTVTIPVNQIVRV